MRIPTHLFELKGYEMRCIESTKILVLYTYIRLLFSHDIVSRDEEED